MAKVYNKRDKNIPEGAVYVGRPTKWGNPFPMNNHSSDERDRVISEFKKSIAGKEEIIRHELRGKDLVCWCAPLPCHADVLLEIANG